MSTVKKIIKPQVDRTDDGRNERNSYKVEPCMQLSFIHYVKIQLSKISLIPKKEIRK